MDARGNVSLKSAHSADYLFLTQCFPLQNKVLFAHFNVIDVCLRRICGFKSSTKCMKAFLARNMLCVGTEPQ